MISEQSIDQVKMAIDEVTLISDYVKLKKTGANYTGLCPFHDEKTASFTVTKGKGYKCFGCGKSGDGIEFIREKEDKSYIEAIRFLAGKYNIAIEEERQKDFIKPSPRVDPASEKVLKFFSDRGISNAVIKKLGITATASEWMPKAKKETEAICFNYYRDQELVNIKFRGAGKDFKLSKDAELIFYNLDSVAGCNEAVIVEGEPDCASVLEAGVNNCVSVPNGAGTGNLKLPYLDNCWNNFEDKKKIIIFVDNDTPGKALQEELARRLGKERCYLVDCPSDCKDANDVLLKHGAVALKKIILAAKQYPLEGIMTFEEIYEEVDDWYENGYPKGCRAGIPGFDEYLTFYPGYLTMVTGIPSSGKDEFLNLIITGLTKNENWKFGICGFEESPSVMTTKIMEKFVGKAFDKRVDAKNRMGRAEYEQAIFFVDSNYFFININEVQPTVESILDKAVELVKRKGIKGLVINPWNYLEFTIPFGMSETNYISQVLTKVLYFAYKYGVHVFMVAHPTKISKNKDTKKYEIPTLYNISGSANFYNKTTNGICVWRDFETNMVDIYIQKCKFHWWGKLGFCSFTFNTLTRQYQSVNEQPAANKLRLILPEEYGEEHGTEWRPLSGDKPF